MTFNKKAALALSIVIGLFVFYITKSSQPHVSIRGHRVYIEIADTHKKREVGLMNRLSLESNKGMLFVYTQPQAIYIWMKNTHIPLDIVWINKHKEIIHIEKNTVPMSTEILAANTHAQYILEINAGLCDLYSFNKGDKVIINL